MTPQHKTDLIEAARAFGAARRAAGLPWEWVDLDDQTEPPDLAVIDLSPNVKFPQLEIGVVRSANPGGDPIITDSFGDDEVHPEVVPLPTFDRLAAWCREAIGLRLMTSGNGNGEQSACAFRPLGGESRSLVATVVKYHPLLQVAALRAVAAAIEATTETSA